MTWPQPGDLGFIVDDADEPVKRMPRDIDGNYASNNPILYKHGTPVIYVRVLCKLQRPQYHHHLWYTPNGHYIILSPNFFVVDSSKFVPEAP